MINSASYIIYNDDINVNAVNGTTGNIDYSNTNNDASSVIQNVINSFLKPTTKNGGLIHIKAGKYNLLSGLTVPGDWNKPHYTIEGEGQDLTIFYNKSIDDAITVYSEGTLLQNFTIDGSANPNSGNGLTCKSDWAFQYGGGGHGGFCRMFNLGIHNNNNGIYYKYMPDHNYTLNCTITNNRNHGILFENGTYNNNVYSPNLETIECCYISGNGNDGIHIESGNTNSIFNCEITNNNGYGIFLGDITYVISNIVCHSNILGGIYGNNLSGRAIIFGSNIQSVNLYRGYCVVSPPNVNCNGNSKWYKV